MSSKAGAFLKAAALFATAMLGQGCADCVFRTADPAFSSAGAQVAAAQVEIGDFCMQKEDFDGAHIHYFLALRAEPRNARAWQGMGNAQFFRGYFSAALRAYRRAQRYGARDPKLEKMIQRLREGYWRKEAKTEY
jgi:tetratricopeptide (TPR) repeat protein